MPPNAVEIEIVLAPADSAASADDLLAAVEILSARLAPLDANGVQPGGSIVSTDSGRILARVWLPDVSELGNDIADLLTAPGILEFVDFSSVDADNFRLYENILIATSAYPERADGDIFPTVLSNADILSAEAIYNASFDEWSVQIELTPDGAATMGIFSEASPGSGLAIVSDGVILSIPIIQGRLTTPVVIAARFTVAEAQMLAIQLNNRPLPIPLIVESVNTR